MRDALLATVVLAQETTEEDTGSDLIKVVPGLMIWTAITFVIVFFVLKKLAFGRIQGMIDARRDRIREALDEADRARTEARAAVEENRQLIAQAKVQAEEILSEARRVGDAQRHRVIEEAQADLERRLEENRKAIEAENQRLVEQIRREVVELTLVAAEKVTGKVLSADDQRRLIDDAIGEIDFDRLASRN
jgi:F-type H+-transporting ATPase subunit b